MVFSQIIDQVKAAYTVIQYDRQDVIFTHNDKLFAVCENSSGFSLYRCYQDKYDIVFLPSYKQAKSFKSLKRFVDSYFT